MGNELTIEEFTKKFNKSEEWVKRVVNFEQNQKSILEILGGTKIAACCQKGMDQPVYLDKTGWQIYSGDSYYSLEGISFCPYCGVFLE